MVWKAALPFLKGHPRLSATFDRRVCGALRRPADLWIQAASAGESFLAASIVKALAPPAPLKVLVTTTTDQGMEILERELTNLDSKVHLTLDRFPFDMPRGVEEAIAQVRPKLMVMLETEIWPAFFNTLKAENIPIFILNARMSDTSFSRYRLTRKFWEPLAPDRVLAISQADGEKYKTIFPHTHIATMANIKFEYLGNNAKENQPSPLDPWIPEDMELALMASFRRTEEKQVAAMVKGLHDKRPQTTIALFPRHMHRVKAVAKELKKQGMRPLIKSAMDQPARAGDILIWDEFGALRFAYERAAAVFVGGSLKPLGGQNFMEALIQGAPTAIGPHWSDFKWVGEKIISQGLLHQAKDENALAQTLIQFMETPPDRKDIQNRTREYLEEQAGGTQQACTAIMDCLFPD